MLQSMGLQRVRHNLVTEQQPDNVLPSVVHRSLAYKSPRSFLNADSRNLPWAVESESLEMSLIF